MRSFLFVLGSNRAGGATETLARSAPLPPDADARWLRLSDFPLSAFDPSTGHARTMLDATLAATDVVIASPLCWFQVTALTKLYLEQWSAWLRAPDLHFGARMADRTMWAVTALCDVHPRLADPMLDSLGLTADHLRMRWGGALLDATDAATFFTPRQPWWPAACRVNRSA